MEKKKPVMLTSTWENQGMENVSLLLFASPYSTPFIFHITDAVFVTELRKFQSLASVWSVLCQNIILITDHARRYDEFAFGFKFILASARRFFENHHFSKKLGFALCSPLCTVSYSYGTSDTFTMAAVCGLSQTFQALLNTQDNAVLLEDEVIVSPEEIQARLCRSLHQQLEKESSSTASSSLRDVFGSQVKELTPLLIPLLTHRVDPNELLPCTQDAQANEEVLSDSNALTLTIQAMQGSVLYAKLLAMPGALGLGLVDIEALTALAAVVRRWNLECCGREDWISSNTHPTSTSGVRKSPAKSPAKKKSRRKAPVALEVDEEDLPNSPQSVLQMGLQVASAVCNIPKQREFQSWSGDARDLVIDAVTTALGTAAALHQPLIVEQAATSLEKNLDQSSKARHEMTVITLRGLFALLQFRQILPNGEKGKTEAHTAASSTLQGILRCLSSSSTLTDVSNAQNTPSKNRRASFSKTPGKSPKSQRKRRSSGGLDQYGLTPMKSPALKGRRQSLSSTPTSSGAKPRPVWSVVVGLLQKLATAPGLERAVARAPTVETIQSCLALLPLSERAHTLRFIWKLCNSKVSMHRLVACELLGSIFEQDWLDAHDGDVIEDDDIEIRLVLALWKGLQGRLMDKVAGVRARAATSLESAIRVQPAWLDESLLMSLRRRALKDETATVRKAATLAMTQILLTRKDFLLESHLAVLCELTEDPSLLTRKAAAESLTQLLQAYKDHPLGSMLEEAWSTHVLPMVLDEGSGAKAVLALNQVIIEPIIEEEDSAVAWRILAHVATKKGATTALQGGLKQIAQEDQSRIYTHLLKRVAKVAYQTLQQEESSEAQVVGVWCLLEAMVQNDVPAMLKTLKRTSEGLEFCVDAWKTMLHRRSPWLRGTLRSCLVVVSKLASGLGGKAAEDCRQSLQDELERFSFSSDVTGAAIAALAAVSACAEGDVRRLCAEWIKSIFSRCENELASFVQEASQAQDASFGADQQQTLVRALFTVGELAMIGFKPDGEEVDVGRKYVSVEEKLHGMHERPSKRLQALVQTLLSNSLPGSAKIATPSSLRAHAFTVLGKFCLRDEVLAKASLNLLARELHPSIQNPNPAVQSNALLVLGDLCVRYTNMTDRYLPVMASCLQAGSSDPETNLLSSDSGAAIVRKNAILLLSSLLLQGYIKWRGLLFHRFLVACSDEDEGVAELAESVLSGPLWVRNPKLFFNNFVEALFVLNKCTAHPIYISAASQGDGGSGIAVGFEGIHLNGEVGEARRRRMYDFLLSKMSDEEKIGVTARLAKEVLGGAVNSDGDLGRVCSFSTRDFGPRLESAWNVMSDAFYILRNKGIKVGRVQEDDEMEDPNIPNPNRQVTVAKSRLLSKISRKHLIEIVLPILCNLKSKLQTSCSPLLKDLMCYLLEIFRNYKVEVKEFLANDPTLLQEIEYDSRQHGAASS